MGKLYGNKGYIGKDLFKKIFVDGVHLITKIRKNMKNNFKIYFQLHFYSF
ncbi:transposase [Mesonia sp.]